VSLASTGAVRTAIVSMWLGCLLVAGGCATTANPWDDTRIEAEVKARLVAEKDANLTRLGVVSSDYTVYLTGTVASDEQKALAESIAGGVKGVKRVVNTLHVRSSTE
jgi:hyperosmotically inducible periplasmic protein